MSTTVVVVVATHDLPKGLLAGVLRSGVFCGHKAGRVLHVGTALEAQGRVRSYTVVGQGSSPRPRRSLRSSHVWEITAISALDKVVVKCRREGTTVETSRMPWNG